MRLSIAVPRRLGITLLYEGVRIRHYSLNRFFAERGISLDEIAYMGDDLNDLPAMVQAGISFALQIATRTY